MTEHGGACIDAFCSEARGLIRIEALPHAGAMFEFHLLGGDPQGAASRGATASAGLLRLAPSGNALGCQCAIPPSEIYSPPRLRIPCEVFSSTYRRAVSDW